jgi:hypothetical protein
MSLFLVWIICCVAPLPAVLAGIPTEITDPEERALLAAITNLNHASMAYKAVAVERMLAEASYFSERLALPTPHPLRVSDLKCVHVTPLWGSMIGAADLPALALGARIARIRTARFAATGVLESTSFFFGFERGQLCYLCRRSQEGMEYQPSLDKLAVTPSRVGDAGAYQLATQSLAAVSVDVAAMEKKLKPRVWRQPYRYPEGTTNEVLLPFFYVQWGQGDSPALKVTIDGTTKEVLGISMQDTSFSRRPPLVIPNARKLNDTPDPPVKHLQHGSVTPDIPSSPTEKE